VVHVSDLVRNQCIDSRLCRSWPSGATGDLEFSGLDVESDIRAVGNAGGDDSGSSSGKGLSLSELLAVERAT